MINKGYQTADRTITGDEIFTPFYAVEPIIKYLHKDKVIWCPFDKPWSAFVQKLVGGGWNVICSHIEEGKDFFTFQPEHFDIIVSNPPFSKKDKIIKRLYELGKPFAILLPIQALQSKTRFDFWTQGLELLCFNERIGFHTGDNFERSAEGNHFASAYFCRNILPEKLVLRKLNKYQQRLK